MQRERGDKRSTGSCANGGIGGGREGGGTRINASQSSNVENKRGTPVNEGVS